MGFFLTQFDLNDVIMERKILLSEKEIPEQWYNIIADMPNKPLPPLHPGTLEPIGP